MAQQYNDTEQRNLMRDLQNSLREARICEDDSRAFYTQDAISHLEHGE